MEYIMFNVEYMYVMYTYITICYMILYVTSNDDGWSGVCLYFVESSFMFERIQEMLKILI